MAALWAPPQPCHLEWPHQCQGSSEGQQIEESGHGSGREGRGKSACCFLDGVAGRRGVSQMNKHLRDEVPCAQPLEQLQVAPAALLLFTSRHLLLEGPGARVGFLQSILCYHPLICILLTLPALTIKETVKCLSCNVSYQKRTEM